MALIRLSKLLSERGICSRRQADEFIAQGLIEVNGKIVSELGTKVEDSSRVRLLIPAQKRLSEKVTILFNKPVGYVSSQPEKDYVSVYELLREVNHYRSHAREPRLKPEHRHGLAPAGRLDIDSQGLLLLTQDGVLAKKIIGESSNVEKEYLVRVEGNVSEEVLQKLRSGLSLDGKRLKTARVEQLNPDQLRFVLKEGKKRQIRRMCEMMGLKVRGLKRVRIGELRLGALPEGKWRFLKANERI